MKKKNEKINQEISCKVEVYKCAHCHDAPCIKMYKNINPDRIIRAIKFDNIKGARYLIKNDKNCLKKNTNNNSKCPLKVNIDSIIQHLLNNVSKVSDIENVNLKTEICGVKLENPFVLSSSIVGSSYEMIKRAFKLGWAGVTTKTICMMQIDESSPRLSAMKGWDNSFIGFKNIEQLSEYTVEENLEMIRRLKNDFPKKIVIASIMGRDDTEWEYLTKEVTKAGADLIELNFSCPNMKYKKTGSDVGQDPKSVKHFTEVVRKSTKIPIIAKLTPNITDMTLPAIAAKEGGANAISAINTIKSITGVDSSSFVPEPQVGNKSSLGGYSGRAVKPIALRFIAQLTKCDDLKDMYFSGMGGIYTWRDALEYMLLGCSCVECTTSVMEYGYRIIDDLILGLKIYMKEKNFKKVSDFIGLAKDNLVPNDMLDKDTIEFPKFDYDKCIGCGRCYISCRDGGHNAVIFDKDRIPSIDYSKCVGCQLCKLVCPTLAITRAAKRTLINDIEKND